MSSPTTLTARCPAKINLFLHVVGRRTDGYHLLESLFCPVSIYDHLRLELRLSRGASGLELTRSGSLVHLPEQVDLTSRACRLFLSALAKPLGGSIHIHVDKNIPDQAGLGGGSSNAAAVLQLLQTHLHHPLSLEELNTLALSLGADVPFFLHQGSGFVEGIGEQFTPFRGLAHPVLVYKPLQNCPTGQIFGAEELTRDSSPVKIAVFDSGRVQTPTALVGSGFWQHLQKSTQNSLQTVVQALQPPWQSEFLRFETLVQTHEPLLVRMSGSGSAMFAVFDNSAQCNSAYKALSSLEGQRFKCRILNSEFEKGSLFSPSF
ncbi:MAG: 4-(cytidine 5'-diphospho)-2-C-methyl-D-erythritol kinase [Limnobacter sp.]|nr:4-(cytidine 5'-diphospho)-2-C-methyl-D-erythritol kinase [Limnobacter sp.]